MLVVHQIELFIFDGVKSTFELWRVWVSLKVNTGTVQFWCESKMDQIVNQRYEVEQRTEHHGLKEAKYVCHWNWWRSGEKVLRTDVEQWGVKALIEMLKIFKAIQAFSSVFIGALLLLQTETYYNLVKLFRRFGSVWQRKSSQNNWQWNNVEIWVPAIKRIPPDY